MPTKAYDFRNDTFSQKRLQNSAKFLAKNTYWKIYTIENILRVIIHSVLSVQYYKRKSWWGDLAGSAKISYERNKRRYQNLESRIYSKPGKHPIYYIDLKDLNEIIRANKPYFVPVLSQSMLDNLMVKIEDIRIPRNIVAHMNFLTKTDRTRIDVFYDDIIVIMDLVSKKTKKLIVPK